MAELETKSAPRRDVDVAITFLNQDLGFAQELSDRLGNALSVFVYANRQEELAGTDGLESFREVFRHRAKLVVILHREEWGNTKWTRIEELAIKDRFLNEGPEFLFLIAMGDAQPPRWLPEQLIRFSSRDFPVTEAIGAIKAKALELGSVVQRPSPSCASSFMSTVHARRHIDRAAASQCLTWQ